MAKVDSYQCDQCGRLKGEVNHWWIVTITQGSTYPGVFLVTPMGSRQAGEGALALCGFECVTRRLSDFMTKCAE